MRAPAYQMYAAEWLADEQVTLLSIAAEGVYIRLLNFCWREGSIPSNPAHLAPLCKYTDVKIIKEAVALFTKSPSQPGRLIHKRLEEEREKQQSFKDKQVINGKLGGRPRKPNNNPDESQTKGLGYSGLTQTEPKKRSSSSSSFTSSIPSNDGSAGESPLPAEDLKAKLSNDLTARLAALTDTSGEILWSESILSKQDYFAKTARKLITAPDVDLEHYRRAMLIAAEAGNLSRDLKGWESWVSIFLTNQLQRGPLLTMVAAAVDLTRATPRHELPPAGTDCTGRHIVLTNTGDANMNRMFAANYQRDYPNATIHHIR